MDLNTAKMDQLAGMHFMHFDNENQCLKINDFCFFLTNSMTTPGQENKKNKNQKNKNKKTFSMTFPGRGNPE